jgi:hypothetical protein
MEKRNNKNKKRLLILVALVGVMGIGGVVAATSITINSGSPLSLGAGYALATTCDENITVASSQAYNSTSNKYEVATFTITGVDASYVRGSGLGCAGKTMSLAYVTGTMASSTSPGSATWTLPSISSGSGPSDASSYSATTNYIYGSQLAAASKGVHNTAGTGSTGQTFFSYAQLTAFDVSTLLTVALSIS